MQNSKCKIQNYGVAYGDDLNYAQSANNYAFSIKKAPRLGCFL